MKKLSLLGTVYILVQMTLSGQTVFPEVFSSFGGAARNTNVDLTFTLGEPLYETVTNNSSILTQGFNQISKVTGVDALPTFDFVILAYPNPTASIINLKIQSDKFNGLDLSLMDVQGRVLLVKPIKTNLESINLTGFAGGIYFLKLTNKGKLVNIIKIQKINEI